MREDNIWSCQCIMNKSPELVWKEKPTFFAQYFVVTDATTGGNYYNSAQPIETDVYVEGFSYFAIGRRHGGIVHALPDTRVANRVIGLRNLVKHYEWHLKPPALGFKIEAREVLTTGTEGVTTPPSRVTMPIAE